LGLTDIAPEKPSQKYQAYADKELFLVTVEGISLERQLYLDKIGEKLGENRWRIRPASFISGCTNKEQITDRIKQFKSLIDPDPAPHWKELFDKVIKRAGLFDTTNLDILVYDLPEDQELNEELLRDPQFRRIVKLVEGRMIAVSLKDEKKFFAILNEHGISHFPSRQKSGF
jgi:hypothetical protein